VNDKEQFIQLTEKLVDGLLREALGFTVESRIPYYRGISGYMVEAPMLWIRYSRFPILFVAYDGYRPSILTDVVKQLEMAKATEFFALLVVVPSTDEGTGNEAEELRLAVNDSVYRHDFVVLDRQHLASIIAQNSARRLVEIILEQGIELSSLSPYIVRGPVPPNMFFGREQEIKEISQAITQTNYALVGGRRIGKSSILQSLDRLLNRDPRFSAYYLNCEDVIDHQSFYGTLAIRFGDRLKDHTPHGFRHLAAGLNADNGAKRSVFLVDEVDALLGFDAVARPAEQLFKTFRALAHERTCSFVFSGSKTLHRHLHDAGSPFFNFCRDLSLRPLSEKSVAEVVSKPMRQLGIELVDEEAMIDRVIDLTSCHPSLVQWLCDRLLRAAERRVITVDDLERIASSEEFSQYFRETAWGDSTPLEKFISVVVDQPEFTLDDVLAAAARYGIKNRLAIRDALDTLQLYALLETHAGRYRYVLSRFPSLVRATEDVPSLIESWLGQVEA
jgi:hypothetical protein